MAKLNTPKGTRDFLPEQVARRNYIFQTVKDVFDTFGFSPIETPAMELKETLMGKYGEEGDRLIFKILARGDKLKKALSNDSEAQLSEEALRYDLTVPFARFVVQHQNDLSFPFKRYQIQPVWRADRPQKGRYREFYQCDVDMIGSDSLLNEVELIQLVSEVFTKLKLPEATIKLNNRKILEGIAQVIGEPEKLIDITVALDKLDKIGREKVEAELRKKGLSDDAISQLGVLFENSSLESVSGFLSDSEVGQKGVEELNFIFDYAKELGLKNCEFDPTLARGLNYYTGAIFEVVHPDFPSSICGGGRYDDLTGIFGLKNVSGVGVSFGADRIYDLMLDKELFPVQVSETTKLMFVNFGETEAKQCVKWAYALRLEGINTEVYPDLAKMKKQMKYANDKNIPFVALVGDREIESGLLTVKDMIKGDQWEVSISDLIKKLK
jgi:histidyl-tRNA synthetase|tara:strand:+ start:3861 stop:5177 length:1317 start_codon:yes stop_codon:yes gene_type:complete